MTNEREAISATCDRIAQRMGGRFVLNEETAMTEVEITKQRIDAEVERAALQAQEQGND